MLRCAPLQDVASHFFTAGTLRLKGSDEEWGEVARFADVPPGNLRLLHQVHGAAIVHAGAERAPWTRPEADGIVSDDPSMALVIRVADCAPLLLADARTGAVAAVHAGWRSTMQRIAEAAVQSMCERFGSKPGDLVVALGPSLGTCCGEMGEEVVDAFRDAGHNSDAIGRWFVRQAGGRAHFDLWRANREQLERVGVRSDRIHVAALCTRTHAGTFHSYRAHGAAAGRMAAVIRPARRTG